MKLSIGVLTQFFSSTEGSAGRCGAMKAQCCSYSAPSSIHCFSMAACLAEIFFPVFGGGMTSSSSIVMIRLINSLSEGVPGTTAAESSLDAIAPARVSSRNLALRSSASGPWHAKQLSERIGRISRLKLSLRPSAAESVTSISITTGMALSALNKMTVLFLKLTGNQFLRIVAHFTHSSRVRFSMNPYKFLTWNRWRVSAQGKRSATLG
jgi:hypothetical protein